MIRFDMVYVYLFSEALIQIQIHFNCFILAHDFFFFFFKDGTSRDEEDNLNNNIEVENNLEGDLEED